MSAAPAETVRWRILGPVEGRSPWQSLDLGPPQRRALLALLLAYGGEYVSMPAIVDALWGMDPPDRAVNVVHRHVGALRRLVEPGLARRAQGSWLLSVSNGYRAAVDAGTLDLLDSRRLAAAARTATDDRERLELLCRALQLWRGPAGADVEPELRQHPAFLALDREQAELAVHAAETAVALGRADRVLTGLRQVARANPADEVVHAQLIRALAAAGRRAQALEAYGEIRTYLVEQLGLSPGPALQAAQLDVLREDDPAAGRRPLPRPAELPAQSAVFVGREHELSRLRAAVTAAGPVRPPVVITGTPGVGKTTLAIRFAHEIAAGYPDGQLYVDLRGFGPGRAKASAADVLARFLEALDVPRTRIPADPDARSALYRSTLSSRRLLIVLDNARDTAQVRPLLPGGAGCQVVVTSRVQLRGLAGDGACWLPLDLLDLAETRSYLVRRVGPDRVEEAPGAVGVLHHLSGGLPLALSLLAARAVHTSGTLSSIAAEVRRSRGSLTPFVDAADPATDLRSVFSWSYDALRPAAARLFRLLAAHPPRSVSVPAAAALAGVPEGDARSLLEQLAEASLVSEPVPGRYARHDLLERYSAELLAGDPEEAAARDRTYAFYTRRAGAAADALSPGRIGLPDLSLKPEDGDEVAPDGTAEDAAEDAAAAWFELEHPVLKALMLGAGRDTEHDPYVWRLAWAWWQHLDRRGRWEDLITTQEAGLAAARRSARPAVEAAMRRGLARGHVRAGRLDAAEWQMRAALRLLRDTDAGSPAFVAETHRQLAWVHGKQDRPEEALAQAYQALDLHGATSRTPARAFALNAVASYGTRLGRLTEAAEHVRASIAILDETGHRGGLADAWGSLGDLRHQQGRYAAAVAAYRRSVELYHAAGFRFAAANTTLALGDVLVAAGHPAPARRLIAAAAEALTELRHDRAADARRRLSELDTRT